MNALPHKDADGSERRVAPRLRTLKRAKVLFNNRYSTFDCIVRNISATGALLTIDEAAHLPKTFEIVIGEDKHERPAKLVYRRGMLAGIRFLDVVSEDEDQESYFPLAPGPSLEPSPPPATSASRDMAEAAEPPRGQVRRIPCETLPQAITRNFPWIT